jgi:hypothetical protein
MFDLDFKVQAQRRPCPLQRKYSNPMPLEAQSARTCAAREEGMRSLFGVVGTAAVLRAFLEAG